MRLVLGQLPAPGEGQAAGEAAVWRCDRLLDEADIKASSILDSRKKLGLLIGGVLLVILTVVALLPL